MGDIVTREQVASLITRYFSQQLSDDEKVAALNQNRGHFAPCSPGYKSRLKVIKPVST